MGFILKPHNKEVHIKVKEKLKKERYAAVIQPTGTGKSYIALKLIEETDGNSIYVAPSNLIINQIKETIEEARKRGELSQEEYEKYKKIKFITYSKLMNEKFEEKDQYSLIILDEFHRCGAPEWQKGVKRLLENNKGARVLGLTATPIRATDGKDMAKELFLGNVASEMYLEEAVARGIINPGIYINAMYSFTGMINEMENKVEKIQNKDLKEELRKKIKIAKDLVGKTEGFREIIRKYIGKEGGKSDGKYIVFCKNIKDMHKKMIELKTILEDEENLKLYAISSRKRETLNEKTLQDFRNSNEGINLLFTVDKLNEGIHIDGIDGVIMLRQTESPIVYMQQLGRALSVGNKGTPLILDLVNNIENSNYIYRFVERVQEERKKENRNDDKDEKEKQEEQEGQSKEEEASDIINVIELQREIKDVLESINEKLNRDMSIGEIIDNYIKHCKDENQENLPEVKKYETIIRRAKKNGELTLEQIERLEDAGIIWKGKERTIDDELRDLINGRGSKRAESIVRREKRYGNLSKEQIILVEKAGIIWRGNERTIDDEIRYISQGRGTKKGETLVRREKRYGNLSEEQIIKAEEAGIVWRGNELTLHDIVRTIIKYTKTNEKSEISVNSEKSEDLKEENILDVKIPIEKYKKEVVRRCEDLSEEDFEALKVAGIEFPKSKLERRLRKLKLEKQKLEAKEEEARKLLEECEKAEENTEKTKKTEAIVEEKENLHTEEVDDDGSR